MTIYSFNVLLSLFGLLKAPLFLWCGSLLTDLLVPIVTFQFSLSVTVVTI